VGGKTTLGPALLAMRLRSTAASRSSSRARRRRRSIISISITTTIVATSTVIIVTTARVVITRSSVSRSSIAGTRVAVASARPDRTTERGDGGDTDGSGVSPDVGVVVSGLVDGVSTGELDGITHVPATTRVGDTDGDASGVEFGSPSVALIPRPDDLVRVVESSQLQTIISIQFEYLFRKRERLTSLRRM
jgi:hypothetical protein